MEIDRLEYLVKWRVFKKYTLFLKQVDDHFLENVFNFFPLRFK